MKSLKEIIKESLVIEAADNKTKQLAKDWVKNYFQKSSGRVKIDQDKKSGDVIIEANGTKITTMDELNEIKNKHKVGDKMTLKVNREGKEIEITLTLQEQ